MQTLKFQNHTKLFDGHCVRLNAKAGKETVRCGITLAALKQIDWHLPHEGLLPSELFVEAFDRNLELIKRLCCEKYDRRDFERAGELEIIVHRKDLLEHRT
jgi:hypothetical protein